MRTNRTLILALAWPAMASAQDTAPPGLAEVEVARSRSCVATLGRMAELDAALDPFARRIQRMRELANAVVLEDSTGVVPFDAADPMDSAVRSWFAEDGALALENVEAPSDSLLEERSTGRERILQVLRDEVSAVQASAETPMAEVPMICGTSNSSGLGPTPDCWRAPDVTLRWARTFASVRKGNVAISVGLSPIIRARSELTQEQIAEFEANLDSLGFQFDHPDFVMAPGMDVAANLPDPIGGETHYILHFGEVTSPQVIWTLPIETGGYVQRVFPAPGAVLALLQEGAGLTVTAIRAPEEEGGEPEAVFSLGLLTVNQTSAVTALLGYMSGGGLSTDLAALVPPS
ncbi:MAG: hypothetical protein P8170_06360 [Gemmatimonadota bacterium]